MRPLNLKTKIFLDSGDPNETREAIKLLGFLDGQTTNPTLISKNPDAAARLAKGEKFTEEEILEFYKKTVQEISALIPEGSVSIEVYADPSTKAEAMHAQGREFYTWIPNAHIKFPSNEEGLEAAETAVKEGMRVNMTLCFSQEQAAAVHAATLRLRSGQTAPRGLVFVSPFIGRLDDRGENGMDLIKNIIKMYSTPSSSPSPRLRSGEAGPYQGGEGGGRSHVEVLTASVRGLDHFIYALQLGSDIITSPLKVIEEYILHSAQYTAYRTQLKPIPYKQLDLSKSWQELYKGHELTVKGMEKFSEDWNKLIK